MNTSMKPNFKDPLDLIKNQKATSNDVEQWLHDAIGESRKAREEQKTGTPEEREGARLRADTWSEAVDRLQKQLKLMRHGKA